MISPAPFADLLILHSFLFLVNLFFDFFSPLSGFSHPSLERFLNLPYLSLFVKYYFYFFLDFLLNTKKGHQRGIQNKKRTGSLLFSHRSTIFAVMMLNFCVRYGYRWFLNAIATGFFFLEGSVPSKLNNMSSTFSNSSFYSLFTLTPFVTSFKSFTFYFKKIILLRKTDSLTYFLPKILLVLLPLKCCVRFT